MQVKKQVPGKRKVVENAPKVAKKVSVGRKKAEKMVTFGNVLKEEDARKAYGMIYSVKFENGQVYVGQKCFYKKSVWCDDYKYYMTSSKRVKAMIANGMKCVFDVRSLTCKSKGELASEEARCINAVWNYCLTYGKRAKSLNFAIGKRKRGW